MGRLTRSARAVARSIDDRLDEGLRCRRICAGYPAAERGDAERRGDADIFFGMPGVRVQERPDDPGTAINIRGLQDFGRVNTD